MSEQRSSDWVFTLNNWSQEEYERILKWKTKYLVIAKELGKEKGTPHLQGFVQFSIRKKQSTLKKLNPRIHWDVRRGTPSQASDYCKKDDTDPNDIYEYGELDETVQGDRSDLKKYVDAIMSGESELSILENHTSAYCKYNRVYDRINNLRKKQLTNHFRQVQCTVYWGPPRTGKTSRVYETHGFENVYKLTEQNGKLWYDGYDNEKVLLIDDFYGWIPYNVMLGITEGYPLRVEQKGSHTYAQWSHVYITSNKNPALWYDNSIDISALFSRLKEIVNIKKKGTCNALQEEKLQKETLSSSDEEY